MSKGKAGRPAYVPDDKDRAYVRSMAIDGKRQDRIAEVIGIDPKTLRRHFRDELDFGKDKVDASVTANLVRQATRNHHTALGAIKWYMIAFMGKGERSAVEHSGAVASLALDPEQLKELDENELAVLKRSLGKLGGSGGDGRGGASAAPSADDYLTPETDPE